MSALPLFVYGTLLAGGARSGLLSGLRRQPARVRGHLFRMPAGYPALELADDGDVHGELLAAPADRVLELLDLYEGVHEGLYMRIQVRAIIGLQSERAWAYVMDEPRLKGGRLIPSGRYRLRGR